MTTGIPPTDSQEIRLRANPCYWMQHGLASIQNFNALLSAKLSKLPNLTRQSEIMLTTIRYRVKKKFSAEECRSVALRLE